MAYRGEVEALEARVAALSADVAERVRERDEVVRMLDEARARARAEAYIADLDAGGPALRRRKRLRIAAMATGLAMIVGGVVAYRARPHRDERFEEAMAKFRQFKDEMCECKTTACEGRVSDEMNRWSMQVQKDWGDPPKLTDEQMKRATDLGREMAECMAKAMGASEPYYEQQPAQ